MESQVAQASNTLQNKSRRWTIAGLAVLSIAAVGASLAWQGRAYAHGPGFGPGMMGMHGSTDPETRNKRVDAMVNWMLADIDATPEQRTRIAGIAKAAMNDLAPLRKQHMDARLKSAQLLAAPTIDKAQLEKIRIEQTQLGDTVSRRMLQAITDAAEVLNPEQRAKLVAKWQERHERRGSRYGKG